MRATAAPISQHMLPSCAALWDEALAPSQVAALYATVLAANLTGVLVDVSNAELLLTPPPAQASAPAGATPDAAGGAASPADAVRVLLNVLAVVTCDDIASFTGPLMHAVAHSCPGCHAPWCRCV